MLKTMTAVLDPIFIAFFKTLAVTLFLTCYTALSPNGFSQLCSLNAKELTMALTGGAIAVGLGDAIYFIGLSLTQATIVAPLSALAQKFAMLIDMFYPKKRPDIRTVIGALLVVTGIVLLSY